MPIRPISGTLRATVGETGDPVAFNGRVTMGAGKVGDVHDEAMRVAIDSVAAEVHWQTGAPGLVVDRVEVVAGHNRASLDGVISPPARHGEPFVVTLTKLKAVTSVLNPHEPPVPINVRNARFVFDPPSRTLSIENLAVDQGGRAAGPAGRQARLLGRFARGDDGHRHLHHAAGDGAGAVAAHLQPPCPRLGCGQHERRHGRRHRDPHGDSRRRAGDPQPGAGERGPVGALAPARRLAARDAGHVAAEGRRHRRRCRRPVGQPRGRQGRGRALAGTAADADARDLRDRRPSHPAAGFGQPLPSPGARRRRLRAAGAGGLQGRRHRPDPAERQGRGQCRRQRRRQGAADGHVQAGTDRLHRRCRFHRLRRRQCLRRDAGGARVVPGSDDAA
jgi:hypothetical protein